MPSWKKLVQSGSSASLKSLFVSNGVTGSLVGTSSWSSNSLTSSYINTLNQNVIISGSTLSIIPPISVGTVTTENVLVIGPASSSLEGGQILLQAPGGTYTSASMLDNYSNKFRVLRGTNAGSDAYKLQVDMHTGQLQIPNYNSVTAFTGSGTVTGFLAFDSNGNILTSSGSAAGGGAGSGTINSGVAGYIAYYPSNGTTVDDTSGVYWDSANSRLAVGNAAPAYKLDISGDIRSTGAVYANANNQMYFRGGDDAEFWDINLANHVGIYGQQDQKIAAIKLGSGSSGITLYSSGSRLGLNTITPTLGTLEVNGNVYATSFTGSLLGTASLSTNSVTASYATQLTVGTAVGGGNVNYFLVSSTTTVAPETIRKQIGGLKVVTDGSTSAALQLTGSLVATSFITSLSNITAVSFTGSILGTASYATTALSASYAPGSTSPSVYNGNNKVLYANLATLYITGSGVTITTGSSSTIVSMSITGATGGGGSTSPGGSNTHIQYNSGSSFAGSSKLIYQWDSTAQEAEQLRHQANQNRVTTPITKRLPGTVNILNAYNNYRQHVGLTHYQYSLVNGSSDTKIYSFTANAGTPGDLEVYGFKCDYSLVFKKASDSKYAGSRVGTLYGAWDYDNTLTAAPVLTDTYANGDISENALKDVTFNLLYDGTDVSLYLNTAAVAPEGDVLFNGLFTIFVNNQG